MKNLSTIAFAAIAALAAAPHADAAFISGTITGQVTTAGSLLQGIIVGSVVSGSYVYDDSTTYTSLFGDSNPLVAFSLSIGTNARILTLDDLQTGGTVTPGIVIASSTPAVDSLFIYFEFAAISSYVGANVFEQSFDVMPRPVETYVARSDFQHTLAFNFRAVSSAAAVPEPPALTMLGLGCVGLAGYGLRSRNRPVA